MFLLLNFKPLSMSLQSSAPLTPSEIFDIAFFFHNDDAKNEGTYPDPLPPTMATFFPAGTVKDKPLSILCPGTYSKWTSSNVILDSWGVIRSSGAVGSFCNIASFIHNFTSNTQKAHGYFCMCT